MVPDSYKMANGDSKKSSQQFSFSQPVQVVGSCQVTTNQLPDLTSSMVSGPIKARVSKEVQPLKFGSVMDILGGESAYFTSKICTVKRRKRNIRFDKRNVRFDKRN